MGKSQFVLGELLAYMRRPSYVIAHDLGFKIPAKLHDGRPTYRRQFRSVEEARKAMQSDPRGLFCISTPDTMAVAALAKEVADESLEKNGGERGRPVVLYIDEAVGARIMNPHNIDEEFLILLSEARHNNMAIYVGTQSPRILHNALFTQATRAVLFRTTDAKDYRRLSECGIDDESIAKMRALPPHKHIIVDL